MVKERKEKCEGYQCEKHAMDIHHIDKDRENNKNNNLMYLCRSCHSKIHTEHKRDATLDVYSYITQVPIDYKLRSKFVYCT